MISSDLAEWIRSIRLDFGSPSAFLESGASWLAAAPAGVVITVAAITVAALALTRRPGAAALIVLAAIGLLGLVGLSI
ncbi:MAG: hypothetical protein K0S81_2772 [Rhodospirillales bacterium]|jgi:hypothetical protein|nr:hypothetical protein [Rhodospirillales bacterium]